MNYSGHRKLLCELSKLSKLNAFILLGSRGNTDAYSCLQIPLRENWFQYVRRVYTTAINFPCISTLGGSITSFWKLIKIIVSEYLKSNFFVWRRFHKCSILLYKLINWMGGKGINAPPPTAWVKMKETCQPRVQQF